MEKNIVKPPDTGALRLSSESAFVSDSTYLIDGGAVASYFCGSLKPGAV